MLSAPLPSFQLLGHGLGQAKNAKMPHHFSGHIRKKFLISCEIRNFLPCVDRKDTTVKALRRNGFAVLQSYAQEKYPPLNLILFTISKPILFHEFYSKPLAFGCKHDRFFLPSPQISPCASNLSRTEKSYPFQQRRSSVSSVLCGFLRSPIVLRSCHEVRYISKSVSS